MSGPEQANITKYSAVDPVRTDAWLLGTESSPAFYREDVDDLACIGITDIFEVRDSVATNVYAAVTLDNSGTYHFHARGTIGYTIFGGDGAYYQGTTSVRIQESADLVLDENGSAHVPISFPMTLTTADGSASATFIIDGGSESVRAITLNSRWSAPTAHDREWEGEGRVRFSLAAKALTLALSLALGGLFVGNARAASPFLTVDLGTLGGSPRCDCRERFSSSHRLWRPS